MKTYPALRVILAAAAALDDIAVACQRIGRRLEREERRQASGPLYTPDAACASLLEESRLHLSRQEELSRFACLINEVRDDLRPIEIPAHVASLLNPYLSDTLSEKVMAAIEAKHPGARSVIEPSLDACGVFDPSLPGFGITPT